MQYDLSSFIPDAESSDFLSQMQKRNKINYQRGKIENVLR